MINSSLRSTKRSRKSEFSSLSKPTKFRVIYKSRSGVFNDSDEVKSRNNQQFKMSATQTQLSFANSNATDIFKSMKNKTTSIREKQGQEQKSEINPSIANTQYLPKINLPAIKQTASQLQHEQENPQSQQKQYQSIEQIEQKVDSLIQLKLLRTAQAAEVAEGLKQSSVNIDQIEKINTQMERIVLYLQNENPNQNQSIQTAKRKIKILQKIMAQSLTQSDIVKRFYYKKFNNRKPKKPDLSQFRIDINSMKQKTRQLMNLKPPASIHYQSLCQINYKAPSKQDYPKKQPKLQYKFNNQPIQRSSYDSDYLQYGKLPKYKYKQDQTQLMPNCTMGKRTSSYQDQFTNKKTQKINFKELDCYRDKFKNLKIPFIHETTNLTNQTISYDTYTPKSKEEKIKEKQKIRNEKEAEKNKLSQRQKQVEKGKDKALVQGQKVRRLKSEHTDNLHYIQQLNTQSHSNFKGQDNKIRSQIKHQNLYAMKYSYKASMHV